MTASDWGICSCDHPQRLFYRGMVLAVDHAPSKREPQQFLQALVGKGRLIELALGAEDLRAGGRHVGDQLAPLALASRAARFCAPNHRQGNGPDEEYAALIDSRAEPPL